MNRSLDLLSDKALLRALKPVTHLTVGTSKALLPLSYTLIKERYQTLTRLVSVVRLTAVKFKPCKRHTRA